MIFLQDILLVSAEQEKARKKMFEKLKKMGFEKTGVEFLFIQTKQLSDLKKLEEKARQWKSFLEKNFEKTFFSIHVPWIPTKETNFLSPKTDIRLLKQACAFCNDFIETKNIHFGHGISLKEWEENFLTAEGKQKAMETVSEKLLELTDYSDNVCVETMPALDREEWGLNIIASLPSELGWQLKRNKKLSVTIDTCHTGITKEVCSRIVKSGKILPGLYREDFEEMKELALKGDKCFLGLGKGIGHVHFSDFSFVSDLSRAGHGALPLSDISDGSVPGKGQRTEKEMFSILDDYNKASGKKDLGVVLEIEEKDYKFLENTEKMFRLLKSYQYD